MIKKNSDNHLTNIRYCRKIRLIEFFGGKYENNRDHADEYGYDKQHDDGYVLYVRMLKKSNIMHGL